MSDQELILGTLDNILIAIGRIKRRFIGIESYEDFLIDDDGLDRLDGIAMMLIAMGEEVKRLDTMLEDDLSRSHPDVHWKGIKGVRDYLSHHYFNIDAETIFTICSRDISGLEAAVLSIQKRETD